MEIRKSRMADLPEILKLFTRKQGPSCRRLETGLNGGHLIRRWSRWRLISGRKSYVCEEDGRLAGVFYFSEDRIRTMQRFMKEAGWDPGIMMSCTGWQRRGRVKGRRFFLHPLVRGAQPGICGSIPTGIIFPCSMCWKRTDLPDVASFIWPMERNGWPFEFLPKDI